MIHSSGVVARWMRQRTKPQPDVSSIGVLPSETLGHTSVAVRLAQLEASDAARRKDMTDVLSRLEQTEERGDRFKALATL